MENMFIRIAVVLTFLTVGALTYMLTQIGMEKACAQRWEGTHETQYGALAGCRVKLDGQWVPELVVWKEVQ